MHGLTDEQEVTTIKGLFFLSEFLAYSATALMSSIVEPG